MATSSVTSTTVDKADVERHSKLMDIWWERKGRIKPLHSLNTIRVPFIVNSLVLDVDKQRQAKPLLNKKILDIGCGGGLLSESLAKLGAKVTGVDASSDLIDLAREHCNLDPDVANNMPAYVCSSIEEHAKEHRNYYDAVVASEVVDHVADVELFLKHCIETLKPGGKVFITTPNRTRLAQFLVIFAAENILNLIPKGIHYYHKFTTPQEITALLVKNNCQVNNVHGLFYNPVTDNWFWSYFQTLWYALEATKLC